MCSFGDVGLSFLDFTDVGATVNDEEDDAGGLEAGASGLRWHVGPTPAMLQPLAGSSFVPAWSVRVLPPRSEHMPTMVAGTDEVVIDADPSLGTPHFVLRRAFLKPNPKAFQGQRAVKRGAFTELTRSPFPSEVRLHRSAPQTSVSACKHILG